MGDVLSVNVGGTFVADGGDEEEEVGRQGALEAEDEEDEDEYVEEERDGEDAALECTRVGVEVEDVEVGFGG